jgi:DNA replication protein DnaC
LDEVGKTVGHEKSGWELSRVLDILDTRHVNKKSTILISNIPDTELTRFIGADMLDRMKEDEWRRVVYSGKSLRGAK